MEALNRPPWKIDVDNDWNRVRELFAMLIGTDAKNIAIVPSTAFAMTLAARNFQVSLINLVLTNRLQRFEFNCASCC